jgi:RHS repeat-associated protein
VELDGRTVSVDGYRYGFNDKESIDEVSGDKNSYDFGARMYNPRIGRWLSPDALEAKHPDASTYCFVKNMPTLAVDPDGKDVIIVIYSGTDSRYKQAAWTRVREIKARPTFDKTTDKVIFMHVKDLGKLEEMVNYQLSDRVREKYGKTVEFSYYGHGGTDGPISEQVVSGDYNLADETGLVYDQSQMSKSGWANIDFNFDPKNSIANFYGCRTSEFAMMFAVFQNVAYASGYGGSAGPTTNPTKFESSMNTYDYMYMWDGDGLIIYKGREAGEHRGSTDNDNDGYLDWEKNDPTSNGDWAEYGNTMRSQEVSWGEFSTNVRVRGDGKLAGYKKK